jgi:tetratricopeptide (TPR) repeat protein
MSEWSPSNSVERRFLQAHEDWMRFAGKKEARLLYWQADDDDQQMVDLYLQMRQEADCAVIRFMHPFTDAPYLAQAAQALIAYYQERQAASLQQGIVADWSPPALSGRSDARDLFSVASSLMRHHPDIFPGLVFILQPAQIAHAQQFEKTLEQLLEDPFWTTPEGERIRVIVPQKPHLPPLNPLQQRHPKRMSTLFGRYQMRQLPGEVVAESGERGPSGEFRRLFVMLGDTLRNDDFARLVTIKQEMLAITHAQQWFDQATVVFLTTGVAYLKVGKTKQALEEYQQAVRMAGQAERAGHPAGRKLVVNALFGEASVWLSKKAWLEAAACYRLAGEQAQAGGDGILAVEGWRMQAWCLDKAGQYPEALDAAMTGLDAGMLIEPEIRAHCGLNLLADWLIRHPGLISHRLSGSQLQQKFFQLFGERWHEAQS